MKNVKQINQVIDNNTLLSFEYGGCDRVVESYSVTNGLLSAYQVASSDPSKPAGWRSFRLTQMSNLLDTKEAFQPRETGSKKR